MARRDAVLAAVDDPVRVAVFGLGYGVLTGGVITWGELTLFFWRRAASGQVVHFALTAGLGVGVDNVSVHSVFVMGY